jgi:hypothetical protein
VREREGDKGARVIKEGGKGLGIKTQEKFYFPLEIRE